MVDPSEVIGHKLGTLIKLVEVFFLSPWGRKKLFF